MIKTYSTYYLSHIFSVYCPIIAIYYVDTDVRIPAYKYLYVIC